MELVGGEEVRAFESEMAAYLGVRQVCGVASGTDALALALQAAGLEPGDEVLVQANAFVAGGGGGQRPGGPPGRGDHPPGPRRPRPHRPAPRPTAPPPRGRPAIAPYYGGRRGRSAPPPRAAPARTHVSHQSVVRPPARAALRAPRAGGNIEPGVPSPVPTPRRPAWRRAYGEPPPL